MQSLSPQERACPHWLPGVLVGLCAAQPLLDVLSFWTQDLAWGSKLTLSLRLLIFLGVMLTGFVLSDRRRFYWIAAAVCAALYAGHVLACLRANAPFTTANLISDATNFIRFAQLPLFTIAFITFLRCCRQGFASLERGITIAFWIIAAVALLSALTGTNPYTYPDKRIGLCGWFYFANSQSAILSMLVPLALCPALRSGQIRRWLPIAVVGFAELFCFATRLAYMSLFVTAIGTGITWAVTRRGDRKIYIALLLCAVICAAAFPVSPMHRPLRPTPCASRKTLTGWSRRAKRSSAIRGMPTSPMPMTNTSAGPLSATGSRRRRKCTDAPPKPPSLRMSARSRSTTAA